jgi:hypothetical protein
MISSAVFVLEIDDTRIQRSSETRSFCRISHFVFTRKLRTYISSPYDESASSVVLVSADDESFVASVNFAQNV